MIKLILDLLENANGETENIRIAQGKHYLPDRFRDVFKVITKESKWKKE